MYVLLTEARKNHLQIVMKERDKLQVQIEELAHAYENMEKEAS